MKKYLILLAVVLVALLACAGVASAMDVDGHQAINDGDRAAISSIDGHTVVIDNDSIYNKESTCTEYGVQAYKCTLAEHPDHTHILAVKPLGHDWESAHADRPQWGIVDKEPSCIEEGSAHDVCLRCLEESYEAGHTRVINKVAHTYAFDDDDPDTYFLITPPTCTSDGTASRKCLVCGHNELDDDPTAIYVLPKLGHSFTLWNPQPEGTCQESGIATRACTNCGLHQELKEATKDSFGEDAREYFDEVLAQKNVAWDGSMAPIDAGEVDFEKRPEPHHIDCYTYHNIYYCPYCNGTVHDDVEDEDDPVYVTAHIWKNVPEEFDDTEDNANFGDMANSRHATCTEDGWELTRCIYDDGTDADWPYKHENEQEDHGPEARYQKKVIPAFGHDMQYVTTKDHWVDEDGKPYELQLWVCNNCGMTEEKVMPAELPPVKEGLVLDEDGVWRYYEHGVFVAKTGIIKFAGEEWWIVNGILPVEASGLTICPDGKAYWLVEGRINRASGWAEYMGEWFILKNGELDKVTGLDDYDGQTFAVESGRKLNVNGLWQDPASGKWAYLAEGRVLKEFTGTAVYDGAVFNVVNGYMVE